MNSYSTPVLVGERENGHQKDCTIISQAIIVCGDTIIKIFATSDACSIIAVSTESRTPYFGI